VDPGVTTSPVLLVDGRDLDLIIYSPPASIIQQDFHLAFVILLIEAFGHQISTSLRARVLRGLVLTPALPHRHSRYG